MRCCCVVSSVFLGILMTGSVALTVADELPSPVRARTPTVLKPRSYERA